MENIAEIMSGQNAERAQEVEPSQASKWLESNAAPPYIMSNEPEAEGFNPPDPVPCEYCGKLRHTKGYKLSSLIMWQTSGPEPCDCPEAMADQEREKARREAIEAEIMRTRVAEITGASGMSARFLRRTFEAFQPTAENQRGLRVCKQYADNFRDKQPEHNPDPGRNGLFITGPMGTGKTHLAAAIANQLMREGTAVICMTMIDLLERIRQTYEKQKPLLPYGTSEPSEAKLLHKYKTVPLLIIDDMGKEPATKWAVSKIYAIINARYEAYLPTIITTNYTDSELVRRLTPEDGDPTTAAATIDRLREMCAAIVTTGDSWRSK